MSRIPEITIKETVDHSDSAKEHQKQRHMLHNSIPVCYIYGETSHNFRTWYLQCLSLYDWE
jgi:hypothetical protein